MKSLPLMDESLGDRLREAGLRVTRPRQLVFSILQQQGGHRSVDEIVGMLEAGGDALSRMTVYNVVSDLTAAGLLMRADAGPGRALYEASDAWHHHFVCRRCEQIFDVPCAKGEKPCLEAHGIEGVVDEAQIIFRGVCEGCRTGSAH